MKGILLTVLISIVFIDLYGNAVPSFEYLGVEDGLSSNFVNTSFVDSYSYIWFGTAEGIDRYDGQEVRKFGDHFPTGVETVSVIDEDANRNLFIGTTNGLFWWDRVSNMFESIPILNFEKVKINEVICYTSESVFIGCDEGFFLYNSRTKEVEQILLHEDTSHYLNQVSDFIIVDQLVFLSTAGGFIQYDILDKKTRFHLRARIPDTENWAFDKIVKYENEIYLGSNLRGLWKYSLKDSSFNEIKGFENDKITCAIKDDERLLFGVGSQGVKIINHNKTELTYIQHSNIDPHSISSNPIFHLTIDDNGVLWGSTFGSGISYSRHTGGLFNTYRDYSYINESIRSIYFDENGKKILGTRNGLYVVDESNTKEVQYFAPDNEKLKGATVLWFYKYKNQLLMGVVNGGISSYSLTTGELKLWNEDFFDKSTIHSFEEDRYGNLWLGAVNDLFLITKDGSFRNFNTSNSVIKDQVIFSTQFDSFGRLWVAGKEGTYIYKYENEDLKLVEKLDLGTNNKSVHLFLDSEQRMWVGTARNGVFLFDMNLNLVKSINQQDGLCNNTISSIVESKPNEYWISTFNGVTYYNFEKSSCYNFFNPSDFSSPTFCRGASVVDQDNTIWFGNEKGLIYFKHDDMLKRIPSNNLMITDLYIEGKPWRDVIPDMINKPIEEIDTLLIPSEFSSIGFSYANLNILKFNNSNISIRMEGVNSTWEKAKIAKCFFSNLDPGEYNFSVAISDASGLIIEDSIRSIYIRIIPPWYQRTSIIVTVVFIIMTLCFGLFYFIYKYKSRSVIEHSQTDNERYELSTLTVEDSNVTLIKIQNYLEETKVYLQPDLTIMDISEALGIHVRHVSQAINENLNQRFTLFVNSYRIKELKRRLNEAEFKKYTLVAIAESCGLNSKSTFNRTFKRITGQTPTEYLAAHHPETDRKISNK